MNEWLPSCAGGSTGSRWRSSSRRPGLDVQRGELLERLDERFRLLTGGRGDVARHQTLQAAVDWSYELSRERERLVFDRLSVFAGGFTLDAAEAVAATTRSTRSTCWST